MEGFDPDPTPPGADDPWLMKPPYARPPSAPVLPPNLENRSKNCPPYFKVSGEDKKNGQTIVWEGVLPLVNEKEEPVAGSKCKMKITCYYNGRIYTAYDWSYEADLSYTMWLDGKTLEFIKKKENCCED